MNSRATGVDLDQVIAVLGTLGIDEGTARNQFELAASPGEQLAELAALSVESEAGLVLPQGVERDAALFDLVDGLRGAGVVASLCQTSTGPALAFGRPVTRVVEVALGSDGSVATLVSAIASLVRDTHCVLVAPDYDCGAALALVVLDRASHERLRAAVGGETLDGVLHIVGAEAPGVALAEAPPARLLAPDFSQRFRVRAPELAAGDASEVAWENLRRYDARVAWPDGRRRPPGDDFLELSSALCGGPLSCALAAAEPAALANLLYHFALVTTVGAHWDVRAARQNPGMSAQGVLGFGQLSWSWFIFTALGADAEAARAGRLLDTEWVRCQERGTVSARQRAWFDLGAFLRHGTRGTSLGRIAELLPLAERAGWQDETNIAAALSVHTEPRGDQLTHQTLYYLWPAPLYALARRAGVTDMLPADNPFLSRPRGVDLVDRTHALVVWLGEQLTRFDAMDEASLPPLLDPLPVIVEARVTEVDATHAHGRTQLAARDDAEHHVVAPHGGRAMKAGEVWHFEVQGSRQTRARARYDDLGEVSFHIALPTGQWLSRVDGPAVAQSTR